MLALRMETAQDRECERSLETEGCPEKVGSVLQCRELNHTLVSLEEAPEHHVRLQSKQHLVHPCETASRSPI